MNTRQVKANTGGRIAIGILLIIVSMFCFLCLVKAFGFVGVHVAGFWIGTFGLAGYAYTLAGAVIGICVTFGVRPKMRFLRFLYFIGLIMLAILALHIYSSSGHIVATDSYRAYLDACYMETNTAGGVIYGLVAWPMMKAITGVGALVVTCAAFFILAFFAILPSIRKNVTYSAATVAEREQRTQERQVTQKEKKERKPRFKLFDFGNKSNSLGVEALDVPTLTDFSQASQGERALYVVDVEGDPMPRSRKKDKGAAGYRPLGSFNPLYPNRDGGYEDEMARPVRPAMPPRDSGSLARDILFGDNPTSEVMSQYDDLHRARYGAMGVEPSSGALRRDEMRQRFGFEGEDMRDEYLSRFRAPREEERVEPAIPEKEPTSSSTEFDFHALREEMDRTFADSTLKPEFEADAHAVPESDEVLKADDGKDVKREVVRPSRPIPRPDILSDDVNPTARKAESAVAGTNVGMLGALNKARAGETGENPEIVSEGYGEREEKEVPKYNASRPSYASDIPARPNGTVMRDGQPANIADVERKGYTPVGEEVRIPRAFEQTSIDRDKERAGFEPMRVETPSSSARPERPSFDRYEMQNPSMERPRYVDDSPEAGDVPSEPLPIRQEVRAGEMSRAEIQSATDVARVSGRDKERSEIDARIENIKRTAKENESVNKFEKQEAAREERVRATSKSKPDVKQVSMEQVMSQNKPKKPYVAPPVDLLNPPAPEIDQNEDYEYKTRKIVDTLKFFNVTANVVQIKIGPTFTMYKLKVEMPRGKTISYISTLESDIAMKMEAESVRVIAPIPGEDAVGIEVPNKFTRPVNLIEVVNSSEFNNAKSPVTFALGKNLYGKSCVANVSKLPHILIAGATGAGKSCGINSLIVSLLYKASPDDVRFIMVDPKRVELSMYAGIPHLLMDEIITETDKAIRALVWASEETDRRMKYFASVHYRDIEEYNADCEKNGYEKMPRIVIIVDEFADLMSTGKKSVEDLVNRIARISRAAGIHLVLATQRPSVDVISGTIKNNFPSRIAFKVTSSFDSKTVIDTVGAEKLLGKGDMLYMTPGTTAGLERIQGAFISNPEISKVVDFVKEHNQCYFDESIKDSIMKEEEPEQDNSAKGGSKGKSGGEYSDDLFDALELGIQMREDGQSFSISSMQRRLGYGFPRAAKMHDKIERMGYLSKDPANPKKEVVTISREELIALRNLSNGEEEED